MINAFVRTVLKSEIADDALAGLLQKRRTLVAGLKLKDPSPQYTRRLVENLFQFYHAVSQVFSLPPLPPVTPAIREAVRAKVAAKVTTHRKERGAEAPDAVEEAAEEEEPGPGNIRASVFIPIMAVLSAIFALLGIFVYLKISSQNKPTADPVTPVSPAPAVYQPRAPR